MSTVNGEVRLGNRYTLTGRIGVGGMAEVWSAADEVLNRPVAVKFLAGPLAADPTVRAAVRREAQAVARLVHPHLTQVFDFGEHSTPSGAVVPYLVMELVEGQNLARRLQAGALPWPQAVEVGADVADGLAAAHRIGLVHLDIKPDNVMLTAGGAKVLDFGIAALSGRRPLAGSGFRVGTPAYAAPERLHDGTADPAADVYALGALLYECLAGRPPRPVERWSDVATAQAVPVAPLDVPGLPAGVAAIVERCLHPEPAQRPSSAEIAEVLAGAVGRPRRGDAPAPTAAYGAAAVRRPTIVDPDPADTEPPSDEQPPPGRLGLVAAVGAVVTVLLVALLIGASLAGRGPTGSSPSIAVTASQPGATRTSGAVPSDEFAAILAALQSSIDEGAAAGEIDPDTVRDLRQDLQEMGKRIDQGNRKKTSQAAGELLKRIDERAREGRISGPRAAELRALLQPLTIRDSREG